MPVDIILKDYQLETLDWLKDKQVAYLALEQGLGKTIVTIEEIKNLPYQSSILIVCPASLRQMWNKECERFLKDTNHNILIISYDNFISLYKKSPSILNRDFIVFDEAHYMKDIRAKRTKVCLSLVRKKIDTYSGKVRFLSGTPTPNGPIELYPVLSACRLTKLSYIAFGKYFCAGWLTPWDRWDFSGASHVEELQNILEPFMYRKTKEYNLKELPKKTYKIIELDLPLEEQEKNLNINEIIKGDYSVPFEVISSILRMHGLRKIDLAVKHIKDILQKEEKIVVFAHHREVMEKLKNALEEYSPLLFWGGIDDTKRKEIVQAFQGDKNKRVFLGSIKAAGTGLTLTCANYVVFVESSWIPSDLDQCSDRCHRIGQKNDVKIDILTIHKSIDAQMLHKVLKKQKVIKKVMKES